MNDISPMGHNGPPDPIDLVLAEYEGVILEAQNWADGESVSSQDEMKAVDAVLKQFKTYKSALAKAGKERTDPLHKAWKAEVAAVKVYTDDADMVQKALVACVGPFKEALASEKREAERLAWEESNRLRREAEAKEAAANAADIEAQREIMAAKQAAVDAEKHAKDVGKDAPKGMRTITHYEVTDYSDLLRWMNKHARAELEMFADDYVRRSHKMQAMSGVRVWETKEAF